MSRAGKSIKTEDCWFAWGLGLGMGDGKELLMGVLFFLC